MRRRVPNPRKPLGHPALIDPVLCARLLLCGNHLFVAVLLWTTYDPAGGAGSLSSLFNQIFWCVLFSLSLISWFAAADPLPLGTLVRRAWPLSLLVIFSSISILWSVSPEFATKRWIFQAVYLGSFLLCVSVVRSPRIILDDLMRVLLLTAAVNLAAVALMEPTPLGHAGLYGQKNMLGFMAALMICANWSRLAAMAGRPRWIAALTLGMALILLLSSRSKTSMALAALAPFLAVLLLALSAVLRTSLAVAAACLGGLAASGAGLLAILSRAGKDELLASMAGDPTFTGRTFIWDFVTRHIAQRPLVGHGFKSYWDAGDSSPVVSEGFSFLTAIHQAHNGYLDVLIELGAVGLVLVAILFLSLLNGFGALRHWPWHGRATLLSVVLFVFLHNLMETSFLRTGNFAWSMLVMGVLLVAAAGCRSAVSKAAGHSPAGAGRTGPLRVRGAC